MTSVVFSNIEMEQLRCMLTNRLSTKVYTCLEKLKITMSLRTASSFHGIVSIMNNLFIIG